MQKLSSPGSAGVGHSRALKVGLAASLAVVSALALNGCEQHPYPSPAPDDSAPSPPPPSQLLGAPEGAQGPPPSAYPPPPGAYDQGRPYAGPAYPGPGYPPQGGELLASNGYGADRGMARPPCPPDASFRGPNAPAIIICNAPVPNPAEGPVATDHAGWGDHHHHRHHHRHWMMEAAPHAWRHHHHHHRVEHSFGGAAPPAHHGRHHHRATTPHGGVRLHAVSPPPVSAPEHKHHQKHAIAPVVAPAPAPPVHAHHHNVTPVVPVAPAHPHVVKPHHKPLASKHGAKAATGAEAERYTALQTAAAAVVAREATLNSPSHFSANQTSDVSLTLPAAFAQDFQNEAAKQNLGDAASSVNVTAALSGEGFSVTPEEPQAQPLTVGQPVVFRWKVTPQANAKAPLEANISADLLSQGRSLPLGSVKSLAGISHLTGRVIGVGLLTLIALVLLGWAARRRRPTPAGATRPRNNHLSGS